jgi:hypothetical protein
MVDWVFNVQKFLKATAPKQGVTQLASWTTERTEWITTCSDSYEPVPSWNYTVLESSPVVSKYVARNTVRTPGISVGATTTELLYPGNDLGLDRLTDLAALALQKLRVRDFLG